MQTVVAADSSTPLRSAQNDRALMTTDLEVTHDVVKIEKQDGSIEVHHFTLADGSVMLDPDVQQHFPNSESVNKALRSLIANA